MAYKFSTLLFIFGIFTILPSKQFPVDNAEDSLPQTQKGILFLEKFPSNRMDSFIHSQQQIHNIPAVSLAIIKEGRIIYNKNYGVVNSVTQEPVDENSIFEAASITKPVFAYTVCRLAQKNVIDLEAPLHKRFPFPELEKYTCYKEMTARHILTHVSGLPNWGVEMLGCPGEKFGYSGQGFEYLTKALTQSFTRKMDRRMKKYLKEEVTDPFDMSNSFFTKSNKLKKLCVDGHLKNKPTKHHFDKSHELAGGMYCNAIDIAKFAIALLERRGLTEEMASDMFQIHTPVPEEEKEFDSTYDQGYGLGIYLRQSPLGMVFGHSGSNGDFKCLFEMYDEQKMGYVIMTNSDTGDNLTDQLAKYLIEG